MKLIQATFRTLFVFSLLGWMYIAGNAIVHPVSLSWPLTHLMSWPREDTFGIVCFGVSIVSYFVWNLVKEK